MVLEQAIDSGNVKPEVIFVNATHIKANVNRKKQMKKLVPAAVKQYEKLLHQEINEDREDRGKKPFEDDDDDGTPPAEKEISVSSTDPESELVTRESMKSTYGAHTACDANHFVLAVEATPGNSHDSVVFDAVYEQATKPFPEIEVETADAGCKAP